MLNEFEIKMICQASVTGMFDCDVPYNALPYIVMAKVNYDDKVYTEGDVKLIEFIFKNRDLYPELFKKEKD